MSTTPPILIYKTAFCPYCIAAARFLREVKKVPFEEIDLTGDDEGRQALMERSGRRTVPQIYIGETHVGGYDDMRALDARGGLNPLLFPS
jgi:glutaredoxin 3